ncbi:MULTISPECIES: 23S rRNA (guanosine(2251)-2'-O)-methyltransferase RlmB [unclassified Granulicatella]|uniref:23S rRNA (guanosine(2251)-2'-O)-methyltransferase RlmB n=1 Tax=unclassified Granulicatella TaxID=2630493 RepID=UPI0025531A5B|nr:MULTISPECIES: 23S rRNA (guanosine(2251)-2'-O)-methyltransferase RlmB [unclassified Granulicatella]MDK8380038.1 23S rRNA (guanosine(2251)-2'-O)-methyltransferase RlmB [Granulicatella sp. UMB5615B]MDK8522173.1 23S rRNA (guanosine(2251)-2'-O)-methyltransferase RlmB [Granulicatella sp. UMB5615A]
MARNEYAPKKKSRNGNRPDRGRPERGEKRQRPAREHVEREGVQEVVDFVFGRHAVVEALQTPDRVNRVFIQEGTSGRDAAKVIELAREKGIQVQTVPKTKIEDLVGNAVHQGLVASIAAYEYADLEDVFKKAEEKGEDPFIVILDGVEDPHNLGSILRTADATGVHGIIIPKRRSASLTATVAKASTGAIEHVPVVRVTNLTQTIEQLKARGIWVFGTDMNGTDYRKWNTSGPLAIVMGNEGKGVSRIVKESVDEMVTIPMVGHVQSLNASVASALMMYEVFRNRSL